MCTCTLSFWKKSIILWKKSLGKVCRGLPQNIVLSGCVALGHSDGGDWSVCTEVLLVREGREILVVLPVGGGTLQWTLSLNLNCNTDS